MIIHAMTQKIIAMVRRQGERKSFIPLVGLAALLATLSMSVPVEWLVIVASLTRRNRWVATASIAALGSAIASLGLYLAFHHFGWNILAARYPELAGSQAWLQATRWLSQYGLFAIFGLMALPLPVPKLPMLAVAGIYRLPIPEVFTAIAAGKIIKYLAYAYIAVRFPDTVRSFADHTASWRGFVLPFTLIGGMAPSQKTGMWLSSMAKQAPHCLDKVSQGLRRVASANVVALI